MDKDALNKRKKWTDIETLVSEFNAALPVIAPNDFNKHFNKCPCGGKVISWRVDRAHIYASCNLCLTTYSGR